MADNITAGIAFQPDMLTAILEGRKTQTRRGLKRKFKVGQRLYIKEALCESGDTYSHLTYYALDMSFVLDEDESVVWAYKNSKLPAMFMPKLAARYFIEIVDVREEPLQSITEEDAVAEGFTLTDTGIRLSARDHFYDKWEQINGKTKAWALNPTVQVITFKRITE